MAGSLKRFANEPPGGLMVQMKRPRQELIPFANHNQQIALTVRNVQFFLVCNN